jgi:polyferredoxin
VTPAAAARLIGLMLTVLAVSGVQGHAQQPPAATATSEAAVGGADEAQPAGGGWNFDDEEEREPTWRELVSSQAVDLVVFPAFAALALVSFFRKSVRLKYVTLAASVAYLGIFRSQMISVVNLFGVLSWNLPIFKHSLFWYLFAGFTVLSTVLWGRLYCGRICAYGALTQLLDAVVPAKLRREPPAWLEYRALNVKYGVLAAVVVYFFVTRDIKIYRYVVVMWTLLTMLLVSTVFVRNLYCRFLCPVGAALGLLSNLTVFGIKRWSECKSCKICEKTCEWGAIRGPKIIKSECVRCDDCERLYMDTKKCPHWIILLRKQDKAVATARQSAVTAALSAP